MGTVQLAPSLRVDVETFWAYHDVGLSRRGPFSTPVRRPITIERFPRGAAVHYRDHAISLGVPAGAIMIEPAATNTSENLMNTRQLLANAGVGQGSVRLIARPYQQRRAYATCRKVWPEVEIVCSSSRTCQPPVRGHAVESCLGLSISAGSMPLPDSDPRAAHLTKVDRERTVD